MKLCAIAACSGVCFSFDVVVFMGQMFLRPSSNLRRETKNPTALSGPWVLGVIFESAPQNLHGPKAYGLGYSENLGG